ncbi:hypothetical protein BKA67DRAFT_654866 [Truncatella angustata]|uniref:Uncharacterized protein n=1 Tax=Truncatella angustata TaxID=152316 RepID=A0A9P8UQJ4_9PEZI|nr:uncharacterized protein BKA67DRAFT_654866 [Truncatella angustata]KAH6656534.1 hypothetical protein BKA67DRAFT_654866 [Truncatella angustata]KAH8193813.1 hypothetical protein TruAng_012025 [Truncatella angustata]
MNLTKMFQRVFTNKSKSASPRNASQTSLPVLGNSGPALNPAGTPLTGEPASTTPVPNTPTQIPNRAPSNRNSSLQRAQQTWSGSSSATPDPSRSSTMPRPSGVQSSPSQQRLTHHNQPTEHVNTSVPVATSNSPANGTNTPHPNIWRDPAASRRRSININLRSAVSFRSKAEKRPLKTGEYTEYYSVYCLEWSALLEWLRKTFDECHFDDKPVRAKNVDHDLYKFTTPRPLTKSDKDAIYKLRWDYDADKETDP